MFPTRLATLISPLATVDNQNVAVSGSTSPGWLPGTYYFEMNLGPHIADMDVLVISVGGNDIMHYASGFMDDIQNGTFDAEEALAGAKELMQDVMENVVAMAEEVRSINPDVDIVYCLYPNYGQCESTFPWGLVPSLLGVGAMEEILELAREMVPTDLHVLLVDMYGRAEGLPLDDYMSTYQGQPDPLHFNTMGQTLYAEEIFEVLGGVLIGANPLDHGATPLGEEKLLGLSLQ